MSQLTVMVTVMHPHPDRREQFMDVDFLVDTGATYVVLPPDVVDRLGLEVRMHKPGCRALFGAYGLELFWLTVDPVHQRLVEAPPGLV